jgi:hypothetical protein
MGAAGIQERRELQNIWPPVAQDLARQKYFEVGFVGAFFWLLFWASKKVTKRQSAGQKQVKLLTSQR